MKEIKKLNSDSKKGYNKPKMKVVKLRHGAHLLTATSCQTPAPSATIWGGEGD